MFLVSPLHGRDMGHKCVSRILFAVVLVLPGGCRQHAHGSARSDERVPLIRVRILAAQNQIMMAASEPPAVNAGGDRRLKFPSGDVPVRLSADGWKIGNFLLGSGGEMIVDPAQPGSVRINGMFHRGRYRLIPVGTDKFDVINDVDIESYLKGVLARELPDRWDEEAFKAQAIAARTYALYEMRTSGAQSFDVYADTRSQVYGGMPAEREKAVRATEATEGVVVAYGPRGREKIFKAYYSSCCGGIGQSAIDALGDSDIPPLREKYVGTLCKDSKNFNWAPVVISKEELTRRVRAWGERRNRPERNMANLDRIEIAHVNRYGRPVRFTFTDVRGARYSLNSEETRWACNADAPKEGPTLLSSFFKPVNEKDAIRFVDGHGFGHGAGLCQWCTQALAARGMAHEDIIRHAYPGAVLVRAY